jgi:DeoR/GlpR family transcriptional regulator of sugar metabolism
MVGDYVMRNLLTTHAEKTFIGCAAVYDNGEFRYDIPTEIGINESMIARTKGELYILVDHSKIQSRSSQVNQGNMYGSCTYDHSLTLITDEFADADCVERLRQNGIKVIQIKID